MSHDAPSVLRIDSLDDLFQREAEILKRIGQLDRGAHLFVTDPIRTMSLVGVDISPLALRELLAHEPHIGMVSSLAFEALQTRPANEQRIRFKLNGLFRRRT